MKKILTLDWVQTPLIFIVALLVYLLIGGPFGLTQLLIIAAVVTAGYPLGKWIRASTKRHRNRPTN
ncbi:hypothetical protein FHU41_000805 [Psychromicrobium silvestre]|uniref:Uncharacterized protein n=1 Tax=Psychromicrobium silvestre TaxID=1645614 RepID=A0A7Y9LS44_9MICC|nr:hypothetical protein [Psychromicrobium silvestre]